MKWKIKMMIGMLCAGVMICGTTMSSSAGSSVQQTLEGVQYNCGSANLTDRGHGYTILHGNGTAYVKTMLSYNGARDDVIQESEASRQVFLYVDSPDDYPISMVLSIHQVWVGDKTALCHTNS